MLAQTVMWWVPAGMWASATLQSYTSRSTRQLPKIAGKDGLVRRDRFGGLSIIPVQLDKSAAIDGAEAGATEIKEAMIAPAAEQGQGGPAQCAQPSFRASSGRHCNRLRTAANGARETLIDLSVCIIDTLV
jgi:hypothetical protein